MRRIKSKKLSIGRVAKPLGGQALELLSIDRASFTQKILDSRKSQVLEIGPLNRPLIVGTFMKYFDLFPTDQLKQRAMQEGLNPDTVPIINFFDNNGDLSAVTEKFSDVISAHCLEHQPDLVRHLQNVSKILESDSGRYWVVLPDKRYCFDALLPESSLSEVVQAHHENQTKPSIWKVIEHRAMTTHNDSIQHWLGNHGYHGSDLKQRWDSAVREFESNDGQYIDVHCWQFTPKSFSQLISNLYSLEFIDFEVEETFETPRNGIEFCAVLKKSIRKF